MAEALRVSTLLETHCPVTFAELRGYASVLDKENSEGSPQPQKISENLKLLLMLSCERES